jgi:hypothetical protein
MSKLKFLLVFLFLSFHSNAQQKCTDYKDGIFKLVDGNSQKTYIIKRKGNVQQEELVGEGEKLNFEVKWLKDCTYSLHPTPETAKVLGVNYTVIAEIVEIRPESLLLSMYIEGNPDDKMSSELIILKRE